MMSKEQKIEEVESIIDKLANVNMIDESFKSLLPYKKSKVVVVKELWGIYEEEMLPKIEDAEYIIFNSYMDKNNDGYDELMASCKEEFGFDLDNTPFIVSREALLASMMTFIQVAIFADKIKLDEAVKINIKLLDYNQQELLEGRKNKLKMFGSTEESILEYVQIIDNFKLYTTNFSEIFAKLITLFQDGNMRGIKFMRILGEYVSRNDIEPKQLGSNENKEYLKLLVTNYLNSYADINKYASKTQILNGFAYHFSDIECAAILLHAPDVNKYIKDNHRNDFEILSFWRDENVEPYFDGSGIRGYQDKNKSAKALLPNLKEEHKKMRREKQTKGYKETFLKDLAKKYNLTQYVLAEIFETNQSIVSQWSNGKVEMPFTQEKAEHKIQEYLKSRG